VRLPTLTLPQKQVIVGIYLVLFMVAIANRFFELGLFGRADKAFYVVVIFTGLVGLFRFLPKMMEEAEAHQAALKRAEEAEELARDKSGDAAETERLRRAIGMPPDT
jgi:hypothetical protein